MPKTSTADLYAKMTAARLGADPGYTAVQAIDGVGPILAGVFVAEIGDVHRSPAPNSCAPGPG